LVREKGREGRKSWKGKRRRADLIANEVVLTLRGEKKKKKRERGRDSDGKQERTDSGTACKIWSGIIGVQVCIDMGAECTSDRATASGHNGSGTCGSRAADAIIARRRTHHCSSSSSSKKARSRSDDNKPVVEGSA
jgi:hypothetical protein